MSQEGFSLSATLKGGTGYDAPWIVVYANDPDELTAKLASLGPAGAIEATIEAANALKGATNAAPLAVGGPDAHPAQQAPAQPAAPQQSQWGGQQQGGGNRFGGNDQPHPEGKQCDACGEVLVLKKTQSGKRKWQCNQWRWNNGNPNGHGMEWAN